MMKLALLLSSLTLWWTNSVVVDAFVVPSSSSTHTGSSSALSMGYVPSGMTPDQYKKLKQKEQQEHKAKRFGAFGPQTFKSRSMQSFQKDLETGKADHLMPMMNAKEKLKKGTIKTTDIPYMQRNGGAWDDSDVKGATKKQANKYDAQYQQNARPMGVDWMGVQPRRTAAASNKAQAAQPPKKKGWFGL